MERLSFPDGFVRRAEPAAGNIDDLRFLDTLFRNVDSENKRRIPAGCSIFVRGWTYIPSPPRLARAVLARLGDERAIDVAYGRSRPDIALSFGAPELEPCGLQAAYPLASLKPGRYTLALVALDESDGYYELSHKETFEIVPSRELFTGVTAAEPERMNVSVDGFTTLRSGAIPSGGTLLVERGDVVYLRGWAIDRATRTAARGIFAVVDDDDFVMGVHGLPREDVARSVRLPDVVRCGYSLRIATGALRRGRHAVRIAAIAADDSYTFTPVGTIEIA